MNPGLDLSSDDFTLFGVPPRFAQDRAELDARWKSLQAAAHPDRFAAQGAAAQRVAMQWAVRVNEAYQRLKDPLRRAAYLCELNGVAIDAESNTAMPPEFLMQQMQWREALEDASQADEVERLGDAVRASKRSTLAQIESLIDRDANWTGAAALVRALMFVVRFEADIDRRLDALEQ